MLCWPHGAAAQVVHGQVVDSVSRAPLPATFVTLVDDHGVEQAHTVSDPYGQYVLKAPAAGSYRIRAKRIGFRPLVSPLLSLGAEPQSYIAAIDPIPIVLREVVVAGERQCDVEAGSSVTALWDEVRAALSAVAWTSQSPAYHYDIVYFQRQLSPGGRPLSHDSTWHYFGYQQVVFRAPADSLVEFGFVRTGDNWSYYAPDADVLLNEGFLRTHCFEAKVGKDENDGLVGLAFAPARGRTLPDVAGTLWLDRTTAELKYLDFKYTRLPLRIDAPQAGGRTEFMRLPSGGWIVSEWSHRLPLAKEGRTESGQVSAPVVYGYLERGARTFEIKTRDGAPVYRADVAADTARVVAAAPPAPVAAPAPAEPPKTDSTPPPPVAAVPAQAAETTRARPKRRPSRNPESLESEEFTGSVATDAYQLVQQYRPNWLASRGSSTFSGSTDALQVYVNNINVGDVTHLHDIPASDVIAMRHLSGPDATMRYGLNHAGGVIEVQMR